MPEIIQETNVNSLALLLLGVVVLAVLCSTRENAVRALLLEALLVPLGQQFVLFGLHLRFFRLLILVGFFRIITRGEAKDFKATSLDKLILFWALVCLACGVLRGPKLETFGIAYDAVGTYFLIRILARGKQEAIGHMWLLSYVIVVIAAAMSYELVTHHNPFYVFGGVPELTLAREGRFRCQGPFRHPILAGTFAAALFPLMVGLWSQSGQKRWRALPGILGCIFCAYAAASSGALMTLLAGGLGLAFWRMRDHLQLLRRGVLVAIIGLSLIMKAPVWFLISKLSDLTGGTGWHRSYIIQQAVEHFGEWWLIGSSHTAHWASDPFTILATDPDNMDITNNYIAQGLQGGLLGLVIYLACIVTSFKLLGRAMRESESPGDQKLLWALGVTFFANCVAFISISYFDQILVFWLWLVATISQLCQQQAVRSTQDWRSEEGDVPQQAPQVLSALRSQALDENSGFFATPV